jgi:hypothetical protein
MKSIVPDKTNALLRLSKKKKQFYELLYKFTQDKCDLCASTGCKCTDRICAHVESNCLKNNLKFEHQKHKLRFIGAQGCIIPPEHRETCTIYLCDYAQNKPGFDSKTYEKLKRICQKIDWRILNLIDANEKS